MESNQAPPDIELDRVWMQRALDLARLGKGLVEPNPMVGCVVVRDGVCIAEGFHKRFGGPHAEVEAIRSLASPDLHDATVYVTLEPCSHHGKTPPCVDLLIQSKPARVMIALQDPFSEVDGKGIQKLREAGIEVAVGLLQEEAEYLLASYLKRIRTGKPWVIAKWAMTLDGKIATRTGSSQWISQVQSRESVHQLRGEMDAIGIGIGTAEADDPLLTVRQAIGPHRKPWRVVFDSDARLSLDSQLVKTVADAPVLVVCGPSAPDSKVKGLQARGVVVLALPHSDANERIEAAMLHLGKLGCTHFLVEGGAKLLGAFHDLGAIDEVYAVVAPSVVGGDRAPGAVGGHGVDLIAQATRLERLTVQSIQGDIHLRGHVVRTSMDKG